MSRTTCGPRRAVLACALAAGLLAGAPGARAAAPAPAPAEKPYIVVLDRGTTAQAKATTTRLVRRRGLDPSHRFTGPVQGFSAELDARDVAALREDPRVLSVRPDRVVRAAALVPVAAGDAVPPGIRRVGAATDAGVREAAGVTVAVLDTGVQPDHPDLDVTPGKDCTGSGSTADANGHGTHVAGIVAARNQGAGVTGVVPGTRIAAVKVLGANGSGLTSSIICGIDWVTSTRTDADPANDVAVANLSLGGGGANTADCGRTVGDALHMAICSSVAAGVTYVVAAGNAGSDLQSTTPAAYPEVLTVTATADSDGLPGGRGGPLPCTGSGDDTVASYSNFATRTADAAHTIAAPGTCIRSTWPGSGYATLSGTSMAAPHVAGLVALCLGQQGTPGPCAGRSVADVRALLLGAARAASAAAPASGFAGDPTRPAAGGRIYGYLASAAFPSTVPQTPAPAPAPAAAPVSTVRPAITGTAAAGATLTATAGTWTGTAPIATTRQWQRCTSAAACTAIPGATDTTYVAGADDVGRLLRVLVTATNAGGAASAASGTTVAVAPPPAPPANVGRPAITGTPKLGATLTASAGTWSGAVPITVTAQWLRCTGTAVDTCTEITGARGTSYVVAAADVAARLRVRMTATNARGTASAVAEPTAAVPGAATTGPPVPFTPPVITGTPGAGRTLTVSAGTWGGAAPLTYTYSWATCAPGSSVCYLVAGAVAATFTPATAPAGTRFVALVAARSALGAAYAQAAPTAPVAAAGATALGGGGGAVIVKPR